jgi:hypothetical protein
MSVMNQLLKSKKTETTKKLRQEIHKAVDSYIDEEMFVKCCSIMKFISRMFRLFE